LSGFASLGMTLTLAQYDHLSSVLLTPLHDCPSPIPTGLPLAQTRVRGSVFLHFKCQMQPCFAS